MSPKLPSRLADYSFFDSSGDVVEARSDTRKRDGKAQPWGGRFSGYRDFDGLRAPSTAEVWWDPPEGRFVYWRGEILTIRWRTE